MTTISRTWLYPLQSTTFTPEDCDDIMRPLYAEILPRLGANRKIPKVYRYAPKSLLGLGLPDIYTMQGTSQIKAILFHMNKGTMVGKLLLMELEAASVELGVDGNMFDLSYDRWEYLLTDCWLKSTWKFCSDHSIVLRGNYDPPTPQRIHDYSIMRKLVTEYREMFTKGELRTINRCRLYLQVMFISDIVSGEGKHVTLKYLHGIKDSFRRSRWVWPLQLRPTGREWKVWQKAVQLIVTSRVSGGRRLSSPIGAWTQPSHQQFSWFYSPSVSAVFRKCGNSWRRYDKSDRSRTTLDRVHFLRGTRTTQVPDDLRPTGIQMGPNSASIWIDGHGEVIPDTSTSTDDTWFFKAAKARSPEWYGLIKNTFFFSNMEDIRSTLRSGKWRIVTDGSFSPIKMKGTAAVIIEDDIGRQLVKAYVLTPGDARDINAYRSELAGILVGMMILDLFAQHYSISNQPVLFGCDNEKAVHLGLTSKYYSPVTVKHMDLIWEIQSLRFGSKLQIQGVHVRGHQSAKTCQHSQLARMNAEADAVAKRYLGFCIHNPEVVISQHLGGTHWSVWCDGRKIVRDIDRNITRYIHGSRLIKHVQDKKGWSKVEVDSVDWETMERVSNTNTTSETLWRMKVASGFVPTANRMTMTKHWDSDICPRCNSHSENLEHLLTCGSAEAVKIRERDIVEFHQTLIARDTDPCIISTVIDTLRSRTSGRFQDHIPAEAGSLICMAAQEQDALGRLSVFQGYQSKTWAKAQEAYWDSLPSSRRKSVRQWACMFLRQWYKFMRHQ